MSDLNMMMRDQARAGLQLQLDKAVTDGDTAAATKIADDIAKLALSSAPKAPPYGDVEVRAELDKQAWFGTDPKRSAKAIEFGKTMDPKKFASAEAFAIAIIKAVDAEFKPANATAAGGDEGTGGDDESPEDQGEDTLGEDPPVAKKPRRTDAPGEQEAIGRSGVRTAKGPWTKLSDAPADVQKEIKRAADKFVSSTAPKEQREKYVAKALESHYGQYVQSKKGK